MANNKISIKVMKQHDYIKSMELINIILIKTNMELGSVKIGQKYASYYKSKFEELLNDHLVNMQILQELKLQVVTDLEIIRADCNRRILTINVGDNNVMMSTILDFILSL
jgi:hypothetical protein